MFRVTGFSINTAVYGLFIILVFFYFMTGNLNFNEEKVSCNTIFINRLIFGMMGAFISKYGLDWEEKLEVEYLFTYLGIFLIGYFYTRMNDRSWSYTNINILNFN